MNINSITQQTLRHFLLNRILSGGWTLELNNGAATIEITAAIQRMHLGLPKTDCATGDKTPTGGTKRNGNSAIGLQAASTTCYYVITMTPDATAAFKVYKMTDDEDAFLWDDLNDAFDDGEIPIAVLKAVTDASSGWTVLTDNWNDGDVTVTGAIVNGVIPVAKPSDLTFSSINA
jgi:hypothetical protein